ncbi:MAG: hypothetical protein Q9225_006915, partial [Loekoesia sp. 1 TL-2023]
MPTSKDVGTASLVARAAEGEPFLCQDPDPATVTTRKQALVASGAQQVENGCYFVANYGLGNGKQGDSAELGVYRNNWHMLRTYCDHFLGAAEADWSNLGQQVHNDVGVATQCQRQLWDKLGPDQFFSLQ